MQQSAMIAEHYAHLAWIGHFGVWGIDRQKEHLDDCSRKAIYERAVTPVWL